MLGNYPTFGQSDPWVALPYKEPNLHTVTSFKIPSGPSMSTIRSQASCAVFPVRVVCTEWGFLVRLGQISSLCRGPSPQLSPLLPGTASAPHLTITLLLHPLHRGQQISLLAVLWQAISLSNTPLLAAEYPEAIRMAKTLIGPYSGHTGQVQIGKC